MMSERILRSFTNLIPVDSSSIMDYQVKKKQSIIYSEIISGANACSGEILSDTLS